MKTQIKVGDRVAVYRARSRRLGVVSSIESPCTARVFFEDSISTEYIEFHYKQLRRLKPKATRRSLWVDKGYLEALIKHPSMNGFLISRERKKEDDIEFIEVRKKK